LSALFQRRTVSSGTVEASLIASLTCTTTKANQLVIVHGLEGDVNVTLGLPIVRTSVDQGTAFDIAARGIADESSLLTALKEAVGFRAGYPLRNSKRTATNSEQGARRASSFELHAVWPYLPWTRVWPC
jgi:hypothetical protein